MRLKTSSERWRTFSGERFECYRIDWDAERAAAYRAAGIPVRKFDGEMFVRPADWPAARAIDRTAP